MSHYVIKFPTEPVHTTDCHDRSMVKLPTGHPIAIKSLERLGCTVSKVVDMTTGDTCFAKRLGKVTFIGLSPYWAGHAIVETFGGIMQRIPVDHIEGDLNAPELFPGTRDCLESLMLERNAK